MGGPCENESEHVNGLFAVKKRHFQRFSCRCIYLSFISLCLSGPPSSPPQEKNIIKVGNGNDLTMRLFLFLHRPSASFCLGLKIRVLFLFLRQFKRK